MAEDRGGGTTGGDPAGKQPSKAEQVAHALRADIATGRIVPGTDLPPEAVLLSRYNVSRPSYREAIRLLEAEGLLKVRRGAAGGTCVLTPSVAPITRHFGVFLQANAISIGELFQARILYEPPIAREIAQRKDQAALAQLAQCASAQEFSIGDRRVYNDHERRFRRILIDHSSNRVVRLMNGMLDDIYNQHTENVSPRLPAVPFERAHAENGVLAKQRLVRLMAEGEANRAERAWRTYVRVYWKRLLMVLGEDRVVEIYPQPVTRPA